MPSKNLQVRNMSWGNKKVVVTGAGGFLGKSLCERLVSEGAKVYAIDDFSLGLGSHPSLSSIKGDIEIACHDIRDYDGLESKLKDSDAVFHLAAIADPRACKENFDLAFSVNVVGTKNILQASKNCKRIICMSSASVYGAPEYVPINENHPRNGKDPYALTKIMGESLCRNYHENYKVPVTIARNFNSFGPGQSRAYLIPTLITQALEKGKIEIWSSKPSRDFTYVDNTIDALLKIAETDKLIGDIVNIGSRYEVSSGELAEKISKMVGDVSVIDLKKETVGSSRLVCDNAKLKSIGWEPKISFEEGLEKTIKWYKG